MRSWLFFGLLERGSFLFRFGRGAFFEEEKSDEDEENGGEEEPMAEVGGDGKKSGDTWDNEEKESSLKEEGEDEKGGDLDGERPALVGLERGGFLVESVGDVAGEAVDGFWSGRGDEDFRRGERVSFCEEVGG